MTRIFCRPMGSIAAAVCVTAACTVATVGGPLVFISDAGTDAGTIVPDGGSSTPASDAAAGCPDSGVQGSCRGAALIGDPCTVDSDCASGQCANGIWCSVACTSNQGCGANTAQVPSLCAMAITGQTVCYPGCSPSGGCQPFPGTTCQQLDSGVVCSP
jgi:hypothetical protein